jgi:hypothetical protein
MMAHTQNALAFLLAALSKSCDLAPFSWTMI